MATEASLREAFSRLQPICVSLAQEQTLENLEQLRCALESVNPLAICDLNEYILFPLRLTLKKCGTRSENLCICCLECLHKVLIANRGSFDQLSLFTELFSLLCCLISQPTEGGSIGVAKVCEELKLETVRCLIALVNAASLTVARQSFSPTFIPLIGHSVTILLEMARYELLRELRVAAIRCVMAVARVDCSETATVAGDVFATFLPGIVSALAAIITGDQKQGHTVTCAAISCWHRIITLVLSDKGLESSRTDTGGYASINPATKGDRENLVVKRSKEWPESTAEKLKILMDRIIKVASDPNWKVRRAMVELAENLLMKCTKSLNCCLLPLLDVLVHATTDDQVTEIADRSRQALEQFSQHRLSTGAKPLIEALEENIFTLASQLPNRMSAPDDDQKLTAVRLLRGYVQLLGPHVNSLLRSSVHLERLSSGLVHILQFDCSIIHIIEERTTGQPAAALSDLDTQDQPRNYFRWFASRAIETEIVTICQLLGYHGDLQLLIDHFMELFMQSSVYRKQAAYCVNEIMTGASQPLPENTESSDTSCRSTLDLEPLVRCIIDEYLQPENWNLPVTGTKKISTDAIPPSGAALNNMAVARRFPSSASSSQNSIEQLNSNIILSCLLLDGISRCATALGREFEVILIDVLYAVLEKVGSENARVSRSALRALRTVASACGAPCIAELLRANADYLVNSVSLRLRHVAQYPEAPSVLRVALLHGDAGILPLVHDVILEILKTLDHHHDRHAAAFMSVLHALVVSVAAWNPAPVPDLSGGSFVGPDRNGKPKSRVPDASEILAFFDDYRNQKETLRRSLEQEAETFGAETDEINDADGLDPNADDEDGGDGLDTAEEKKDPPDQIKLVIEVFKRCQHLLMSSDPRLRLLVLDTLAEGCLAMRSHRDDLLPLVHCVWKPFVQRFSDAEPYVAIKAFNTLRVMAETSGDFIRRRFVDDILPRIITALEKLSTGSLKAGPSYRFSQNCKLQLCILSNVGPLSRYVDVDGLDLHRLLVACLPYLSCRQPACLQQACVEAFSHFAVTASDDIWLLLNDIYCPQGPLIPPSDCLPVIQMAGSVERNEYSDNIDLILKFC